MRECSNKSTDFEHSILIVRKREARRGKRGTDKAEKTKNICNDDLSVRPRDNSWWRQNARSRVGGVLV